MKIMIVFPFLLALVLNLGAQQPKRGDLVPVQAAEPSSFAPALLPGASKGRGSAKLLLSEADPSTAKSRVKNIKQTLLAANEGKKTPQPRKKEPAETDAEQEADEGSVMIDSKADEDSADQPEYDRPPAETEDANLPAGMPASYGQLKGAFDDGGRNILVFENEEGVMAFVQVFVGKNAISWKLISRTRRSGD
ncbi:MAG: hypothetical protein KKH28_14195 [Elusimicrobia bacterium]|nr:hypothetical protein [Elusimicrobiota bacterium]